MFNKKKEKYKIMCYCRVGTAAQLCEGNNIPQNPNSELNIPRNRKTKKKHK